MQQLLFRRLGAALLVLPGIVTLLFLVFSLLGDPARMLAGQRGDAATLKLIRRELGLDAPLPVQYLRYLNDLSPVGTVDSARMAAGQCQCLPVATLDNGGAFALKLPYLRRSYQTARPVLDLLLERFPATLLLAVSAMLIAAALGIPLGVWAAARRDTWADRFASGIAVLGVSAPSFFVAVLLAWLLSISLHEWTGLNLSGYVRSHAVLSDGYVYHWRNLLLPALTLGIRPMALLFQLARGGMIDVLQADYIRTARAKGLSERRVLWRHALPNALGPVITALSGWFASLLTGAFFVEYVFDWPGIGKLTVDALFANDYPVVLGACLFTASIFILTNLVVDLLYPLIDPRVRTSRA